VHLLVWIINCDFYITYLLTPWSRVLLEKLAGLQPIKKFPAFYGTRRFLTALTSARHETLSWASPIQSSNPHRTSWRSILTLPSHLRLGLPSGLFPSGYPPKWRTFFHPQPEDAPRRGDRDPLTSVIFVLVMLILYIFLLFYSRFYAVKLAR
jgi:hypothetical protein